MNNFRSLFDLRAISVGVIITRCDDLQDIFNALGRGASYGSSTTHMSKLLPRYPTLSFEEIGNLPVASVVHEVAHLYLWVPNALLPYGLRVMEQWGFEYKTNLIWYKVRKDGGSDRRGVGFYFRNVTEMILFGVRGKHARTLQRGRSQENIVLSQKREHSRKPDAQYEIIESCSPGPYLELFARGSREGWHTWGNQSKQYLPDWNTYANHSQSHVMTNGQLTLLHPTPSSPADAAG